MENYPFYPFLSKALIWLCLLEPMKCISFEDCLRRFCISEDRPMSPDTESVCFNKPLGTFPHG